MQRPRFSLVLCFCLSAVGIGAVGDAEAYSPYRFQEIYHANAAAVVRIRAAAPEGDRYASAFLVRGDGILVAPAASVQDAAAVHLIDPQGKALRAVVVAIDPALGVAVLRAPSRGGLPTLKIGASTGLRNGDWVVGISHDNTGAAEAMAGCVSEVIPAPGRSGSRLFVVDTATGPGGPVLNLDGEVVAVSLRRRGARRADAVGIDDVRRLLLRVSGPSSTTVRRSSIAAAP